MVKTGHQKKCPVFFSIKQDFSRGGELVWYNSKEVFVWGRKFLNLVA